MGWLLLRQRVRLVAARKAERASSPGRRLSRSLFSLSCILLCAVRNDGLRTHSSSVSLTGRRPRLLTFVRLRPFGWSTLFLRPRITPIIAWSDETPVLFVFVVGEHGEQLAVGNRREFFLCFSRVRRPRRLIRCSCLLSDATGGGGGGGGG